MRTHTNAARSSRLPRRLLTAVGTAAVIPLTFAPLAPALASEGLTLDTTVAQPVAQDSAPESVPGLAAVSPETELPAAAVDAPALESAPPAVPAPAAPTAADAAAPDPGPEPTNPAATPTAPAAPAAATPGSAAVPTAATTGPEVTANLSALPASGWYRTRQPVRFVAEDAGSGVRSITVVVDDTTTERAGHDTTFYVEGNGSHTIEYWATDTNGRNGATKTLFMATDGAAPRIATGAPSIITQGAQVALGLDCWDEHSGVQSCYATGTDDEVLPSEELGEHAVTLHSRDYAGNEASGTFTYVVKEREPQTPELQFNIAPEPASGWYRGPVGVIVSASTTDVGDRITGVHWATRGPITASGSAVDENGVAFTIEGDGVTQVSYTATTARGGLNSGEATVRIDGVQPEVHFSLLKPSRLGDVGTADGRAAASTSVVLGSSARVGFECSDAHSGIDFCGEELPLLPTEGSLALDTGSLGKKQVVVESADVAGNRTKATFEYEVVAPGDNGSDGSGDAGGSGGAGGDATGHTPTKPETGSDAPANRSERLAQTGFSWAPLGAIGVAAVAAGAVISLMRFRDKNN